MSAAKTLTLEQQPRPDIYVYHDYRSFLKDWIGYLRTSMPGFSARELAKQSGVSESYLSMVFSGERSLSDMLFSKLLPHLGLDVSEQSYLGWLIEITDASDADQRLQALKKIQRFRQYRELNSLEIETYHYLTNWHYVAIRELASLPNFQADAKWIQKQLKVRVPLKDIKKALEFLLTHGFLQKGNEGKVEAPDRRIHCKTGVLRPALTQFHRDMLGMACDSIENTPSEERNISAHTCAIPAEKFAEAKRILEEARERIIALTGEPAGVDTVYHFSFLAFPLTKRDGE